MRIAAASFACLLCACAQQGVVVTDDLTIAWPDDPGCRPDVAMPIRLTALGDFPTTDSVVTYLDATAGPRSIDDFPFDMHVLAADVDTRIGGSSATLSGTRQLGDTGITGHLLMLPTDRPCRLDDDRLGLLQGQTVLALPDGSALLIGGLRDGRGEDQVLRLDAGDTSATLLARADALFAGRAFPAAAVTGHRVVVAGGAISGAASSVVPPIEVYDITAGRFDRDASAGLSLITPRLRAAATALPDGRVVVVGGISADGAGVGSAEIIDVDGGRVDPQLSFFSSLGPHNLVDPWVGVMEGGVVLVAGGSEYELITGTFTPSGYIEQFSAEDHRFIPFGEASFAPRASATVVPLPGDRLAYVGLDPSGVVTVQLLHVPAVGPAYVESAPLVAPPTLASATAAATPDGRLLVGGADSAGNPLAYIVDLSRDSVQQVMAKVRATEIVPLGSGALLELSPEGASMRRPSTLDAFSNPGTLLAGGTTDGIALDDGGHWVTTRGVLVAHPTHASESRLTVPTLAFGDARITFQSTGDVRLLLSAPGLATKSIHVSDDVIGLAACTTGRSPGQRVTVERHGDTLLLGVEGAPMHRCVSAFGTLRFGIGFSASEAATLSSLVVERSAPLAP